MRLTDSSRTRDRKSPKHAGDPHVLLAEDDAALRDLMTDVLVHQGYRVTSTANAYEMEDEIRRSLQPSNFEGGLDLVVSDILMPGKTGLAALLELRRTGVKVPFLFVTSFPDIVAYQDAERLDAQLLPKPFTLEELRAATVTILVPRNARKEPTQ